ncbi:16292_t:CDS:10 [Cetraspora pellucida]|uniref:16292_t:CDS:1 n=1 Tax=Cetraspora pellucida TaxID=1433469 RepID=A0A9N8ZJQ5_9GLOM|nr:16292_t:CDS:10 [Cetraspora pellucida]
MWMKCRNTLGIPLQCLKWSVVNYETFIKASWNGKRRFNIISTPRIKIKFLSVTFEQHPNNQLKSINQISNSKTPLHIDTNVKTDENSQNYKDIEALEDQLTELQRSYNELSQNYAKKSFELEIYQNISSVNRFSMIDQEAKLFDVEKFREESKSLMLKYKVSKLIERETTTECYIQDLESKLKIDSNEYKKDQETIMISKKVTHKKNLKMKKIKKMLMTGIKDCDRGISELEKKVEELVDEISHIKRLKMDYRTYRSNSLASASSTSSDQDTPLSSPPDSKLQSLESKLYLPQKTHEKTFSDYSDMKNIDSKSLLPSTHDTHHKDQGLNSVKKEFARLEINHREALEIVEELREEIKRKDALANVSHWIRNKRTTKNFGSTEEQLEATIDELKSEMQKLLDEQALKNSEISDTTSDNNDNKYDQVKEMQLTIKSLEVQLAEAKRQFYIADAASRHKVEILYDIDDLSRFCDFAVILYKHAPCRGLLPTWEFRHLIFGNAGQGSSRSNDGFEVHKDNVVVVEEEINKMCLHIGLVNETTIHLRCVIIQSYIDSKVQDTVAKDMLDLLSQLLVHQSALLVMLCLPDPEIWLTAVNCFDQLCLEAELTSENLVNDMEASPEFPTLQMTIVDNISIYKELCTVPYPISGFLQHWAGVVYMNDTKHKSSLWQIFSVSPNDYYVMVEKYVQEMVNLLVSDSNYVRESVKEILGSELSPPIPNERYTLFVDQAILGLKLTLKRIDDLSENLYACNFGNLVYTCRIINRKNDYVSMRMEIKLRNRLLEIITEWTSDYNVKPDSQNDSEQGMGGGANRNERFDVEEM